MAPDRRGRLRAGLHLACYLLVAAILVGLALLVLGGVVHLRFDASGMPPLGELLLLQVLLVFATVLAPTALLLAITRDDATAFGWGVGDRMRQLGIGIASGAAVMALLVGLIAALHGASVQLASAPAGAMLLHGLLSLGVFALVAIGEEGLLRGYPLIMLSRAISFWPAAVISSLVFALLHAPHGGESVSGILHASLTGLVLAYSVRRSGGLWFALGWHAAWDFTETFLFGAPDSGVPARDSMFVTTLYGPAWLTGGAAGPEGSWFVLPILALVALLIRLLLSAAPPGAVAQSGAARRLAADPTTRQRSGI